MLLPVLQSMDALGHPFEGGERVGATLESRAIRLDSGR